MAKWRASILTVIIIINVISAKEAIDVYQQDYAKTYYATDVHKIRKKSLDFSDNSDHITLIG